MAIEVPPIRILIVDDDKSICEYVQTLLERDGFQVETQCDPLKVEETVKAGEFHLIFLDLMMPRMDGIEVLRRIRARGDGGPAVLILTAAARNPDAREREGGHEA